MAALRREVERRLRETSPIYPRLSDGEQYTTNPSEGVFGTPAEFIVGRNDGRKPRRVAGGELWLAVSYGPSAPPECPVFDSTSRFVFGHLSQLIPPARRGSEARPRLHIGI